MRKRGAILLKMKYLKNEIQIEKSVTPLCPQASDSKLQQEVLEFNGWYLREMELAQNRPGAKFFKLGKSKF